MNPDVIGWAVWLVSSKSQYSDKSQYNDGFAADEYYRYIEI